MREFSVTDSIAGKSDAIQEHYVHPETFCVRQALLGLPQSLFFGSTFEVHTPAYVWTFFEPGPDHAHVNFKLNLRIPLRTSHERGEEGMREDFVRVLNHRLLEETMGHNYHKIELANRIAKMTDEQAAKEFHSYF